MAARWRLGPDHKCAGSRPDAVMPMIGTSVVHVRQHGTFIADNNQQDMGRLRGGITSKSHAVLDSNGLPSIPD